MSGKCAFPPCLGGGNARFIQTSGLLEGFEKEFYEAGLAVVGKEGLLRDPDVVRGQGGTLGAFAEVEIRENRAMRQLVFDAATQWLKRLPAFAGNDGSISG